MIDTVKYSEYKNRKCINREWISFSSCMISRTTTEIPYGAHTDEYDSRKKQMNFLTSKTTNLSFTTTTNITDHNER